MSAPQTVPLRIVKRREHPDATVVSVVALRTGRLEDAESIHQLIEEYLAEGHLLPRSRDEIRLHVHRFVVAVEGDRIVACGELAPLSHAVAEVRSLVVGREERHHGLGQRIIEDLVLRATRSGFEKLCAFTHAPAYFVHLGFSIIPHVWLPDKIVTDCHSCMHFRHCGQYAVVRTLVRTHHSCVPLAALHG